MARDWEQDDWEDESEEVPSSCPDCGHVHLEVFEPDTDTLEDELNHPLAKLGIAQPWAWVAQTLNAVGLGHLLPKPYEIPPTAKPNPPQAPIIPGHQANKKAGN